ncbi:mandelate racemase/muconate lactonizing enzyme family protein [Notoacmeibacter ruber]|uniref:Mandelate racemase n=1 Tax=Notoacmeibacter ruber TaxID=2670375 RepID=A0A3L7J446_9HYPH|nr:enolase C-terminal domain-like protein [Notoacmeibacter ruber]RLQ85229.1 mandelate racemase [Notoacmeibacter ruber]
MPFLTEATVFKGRYDLGGYKLSYGEQNDVYPIIVKLVGGGHEGWGEANPWQPFTSQGPDDDFDALEKVLLPIVRELDSVDPWDVQSALDERFPDRHLMAKGAINMALMDLEAKKRGVRVADLLGNVKRMAIEVSRPTNNGTAEDVLPTIEGAMAEGYRQFMLKAGDANYPAMDEIERLRVLKERCGERAVFKIDANTGWSRDDARALLAAMPQHLADYLAYLEQPIAADDIDGLAELQAMTSIPISVDESLTDLESARRIIEKKAARVFSVKISKNGGLLTAQKIARLAAEHGIAVYPNSMAEGGITQVASLHLAATLDNLADAGGSYRSVLRLGGLDVTNLHTFIKRDDDGLVRIHLPDGPGFGLDVDEAKLRANALRIASV